MSSELKLPAQLERAGYCLAISGSGANLHLRHYGESVDWWPRSCNAKEKLEALAWKREGRRRDVQDVLREVPN